MTNKEYFNLVEKLQEIKTELHRLAETEKANKIDAMISELYNENH